MKIDVPENKINATHWAVAPDNDIMFYKLGKETLQWLPLSKIWIPATTAQYTFYCFDDYEEGCAK